MTLVQRTNPVGQLLSSNSMLTANNRNVAARFIDGAEQTVANLNYAIRPTVTQLNTAPSLFVPAADSLTISQAGIYQVNWGVQAEVAANPSQLRVRMVKNFNDIQGCTNFVNVGTWSTSHQWMGEFHFEAGDSLAFWMQKWVGGDNITMPADGCRIGIQCLYKLGDS